VRRVAAEVAHGAQNVDPPSCSSTRASRPNVTSSQRTPSTRPGTRSAPDQEQGQGRGHGGASAGWASSEGVSRKDAGKQPWSPPAAHLTDPTRRGSVSQGVRTVIR
jgi:hypothetical protein